ncbi:MAG: hypothetical protein KAV42_11995, partial [Candidatus Krumholzibacteria bacterium]|nr:hypothetical protein [Candidatus Krumholzibacteria bacterium]
AMVVVSPAMAYDFLERETTINVQIGLISPGPFWVEDIEFDTDMSFGIMGGLDYKLGPKISGGIVAGFNNFSGEGNSATMIEFGFLIKAWIHPEESSLLLRPGFGLSYGKLGSIGESDTSNYLIVNCTFELVILTEKNFNYLVMIGLTGGPAGGNDDNEMTYGPGFILRGGVAF